LHPTIEEQKEILDSIYRGDEDYPPSPGNVINVDHSWMAATHPLNRFENTEDFIMGNWHVDNPFLEYTPALQSMRMDVRTETVRNDDTIVASLEYLYEIMPEHMKEYLEDLEVVHSLGADSETHHGEDELTSIHYGKSVISPALRTHPVTGKVAFWFSPTECVPVGGTGERALLSGDTRWDTSKYVGSAHPRWQEVKVWMLNELRREDLRFRWSWDVGDLFIWDNRNLIHAFSPEFEFGERVFTRYEVGLDKPYYNPSARVVQEPIPLENPSRADHPTGTAEFDDPADAPSKDHWENAIGNPDHIPLVLTEGIYALPEYKHLVNSVTLFVITEDAHTPIPDEVMKACSEIDDPDFHVVQVPYDPDHMLVSKYAKYWNPGIDSIGQIFLFTKNGDVAKAYKSEADPFFLQALHQIDGMLLARRDLRHAGHAWHYPDFMNYPSHKVRPYRWENLAFMDYAHFDGDPPNDFLVQFAIDTVFGCFNHLKTNEERKEIIEEIRDFLNLMLKMNEHEIGR
jgi:alpha-ketoglutarate-dependent taurine dioxygenase/cytochrome oxidase Cu insertion factor (SCO1/SenC/PrrC family)